MREYFANTSFDDYNVVQLQLVFFIIAYISCVELRSFLQSSIVLLAFIWFDGKFASLPMWISCLAGLTIGEVTARSPIIQSVNQLNSLKIFQVFLLPVALIYISACYVDQTDFPVGIIMSFIAWLGVALIVSGAGVQRHPFVYVPVLSIFIWSFVFFWLPWLPLLLSSTFNLAALTKFYQVKVSSAVEA
ncbi:MAG: hypothetical protein BVN35_17830 [Proteobacteria bacterium ST_bin11]|nr:MAG: hypothetical protein BVN35_17830 [Proteobacteria bacterium ST_bin11]